MSFETELNKIIEEINKRALKIKFYGAVGIKLLSQSHARKTFDIDFLALSKDTPQINTIFKSLNYRSSVTKKRSDLVFFKKEPIKMKIDIELNRFKIFDKNLEWNLTEVIESKGLILPPHFLFITKLCAPLDEDNIYDIGYLLAENPINLEDLLLILNDPHLKFNFLFEKISHLPDLVNKHQKIEKNIKMKANRFLKLLKRSLNR